MDYLIMWFSGFIGGYILCMIIRNYEQRKAAYELIAKIRKLAESDQVAAGKLVDKWFKDIVNGG
tara:strand:- start:294 stop:485 length:192 start_codon:yes stop_codon:yes gene_type:complete